MKIGMYVPSWPPGSTPNGIVTYASYMVPALRKLGNEVYVLTADARSRDPYAIDIREFIEPRKFWHRILGTLSPSEARFNVGAAPLAAAIKHLVEQKKIEILEMEETFGLSYAVSKLNLIPVVVRLHGPWFLNKRSEDADRERREGRAIKAAQVVTSPSLETLKKTVERYGLKQKHLCIQNPIEMPDHQWSRAGCDRNSILFVGRFDKIKGGDLVLEAFGNLASERPELKLTFIGPGIDGTPPGVNCTGTLPYSEVAKLRTKHFLTISASRYEVFGYTVLEAMSFGCPVVASNIGGIPELIHDGENGLLFDAGNVDSMVQAIQRLLDNPELAEKLGVRARWDSANFYKPDQQAVYTAETYRQEILKFPFRRTVYVPDQHEYC